MGVDLLGDLIEEMEFEEGNAGEYFGGIDEQPAILSVLSANPPGVIVKIRLNTEKEQDIEVSEPLFELLEKESINISVDNGYGWLTVYDLSGFTTEKVVDLLETFAQDIEEHQLSLGAECVICKNGVLGEIYYSEGKINQLCANCLEEKVQQQSDKNKKLAEIKTSSVLLTLLGVMGFAVAWALMWLLYDYIFVFYRTNEIEVSEFVLVGVPLVAVVILAFTLGLPLRRFRIQNRIFLSIIATILAFASFILGEVSIAIIRVVNELEAFAIITSIQYYIYSWKAQMPIFHVVKIGLVIGAIIGINMIAKKKKAALEI